MLAFPGDEKNQRHPGANAGVGDIERREADFITTALLDVKIDEIDDLVSSRQEAVGEVSGDAAKNQPEGDLAGEGV